MDWSGMIQEERAFFSAIGTRLVELQTEASGNLAMEEIYAGVWQAYQSGMDALSQFESDMEAIQSAINTGQIDNHYVQMFRTSNVPQDRWVAAMHIIACLRCLKRPSMVFRQELQRQTAAIVGKLQATIRDTSLDTVGVTQDMHTIGLLLCSFDIPTREPTRVEGAEHWLKGFLKPQSLVLGAAAVAGTYFVLEKTSWVKKKPKKAAKVEEPEEIEVEEIEEPEEELVFEVDEDLPALTEGEPVEEAA